MVLVPPSIPFQVEDTEWLNEYGWALLALFGAITLSLYIWSYVNKNFEVWKTQEGRYFDSEVLDFTRRMVQVFIIMFLAIAGFVVVSLILGWTDLPAWMNLAQYILHAMFIVITVLVAMLVVRILRRVSRRSRIKAANGVTLPSAVEITSLALTYVIYIIAFIIVIFIILLDIDLDVEDAIGNFLVTNQPTIAVTLAIVVGIYFVTKLVETILEDYKFRSKKFNPQVIDLLEKGVKYALYVIGFLIVVFNLFMMIGMETVGILLVLVTLVFIILGIALSYSTIQNVVSGLALMDTSPFDIGDRIQILGGMMCDVIEKGLVFTKVKSLDGEIVDVPNNELIQERIYNYSRAVSHAINIFFEVSFKVPHQKVEAMVREALEEVEGVLKDPRPELRAVEFKGDNILYEIVVFSRDVQADNAIRSKIIFRVQEVFQADGRQTG
mgnify:CR=1 FL=1